MTGETSNQDHDKNVQIFPISTVQTVEICRSWHGDIQLSSQHFTHLLSLYDASVGDLFGFFFRPVAQDLSRVLLFLTFFSSSFSLAPSRVKMMPVWELRPTADTNILPDPSITWVPGERSHQTQLKLVFCLIYLDFKLLLWIVLSFVQVHHWTPVFVLKLIFWLLTLTVAHESI